MKTTILTLMSAVALTCAMSAYANQLKNLEVTHIVSDADVTKSIYFVVPSTQVCDPGSTCKEMDADQQAKHSAKYKCTCSLQTTGPDQKDYTMNFLLGSNQYL